jgi:Flp pilus assembly pilin Flp
VFRVKLRSFSRENAGQDLAEFCLITALVALVGLAIFVHLSGGVQAIWGGANNSLVAGQGASGGTGATGTSSAAGGGAPASTGNAPAAGGGAPASTGNAPAAGGGGSAADNR